MFSPPVREDDLCTIGDDWCCRGFFDSFSVRRQVHAPRFRPKRQTKPVKPRFRVAAQREKGMLDSDGMLDDDCVFEMSDTMQMSSEELALLIEQMKSLSVDVYDRIDDAENGELTTEERTNEYGEFAEELDFPEERDEWEDEVRKGEREERCNRMRDVWIRWRRENEIEDVLEGALDVEEGMRLQRQIEEEQEMMGDGEDALVEALLRERVEIPDHPVPRRHVRNDVEQEDVGSDEEAGWQAKEAWDDANGDEIEGDLDF